MGLGAMTMEGYSTFPKDPALPEATLSDCLMSYPGYSLEGGSYLPAEMQSVYSTAPTDWTSVLLKSK